MGITEQELVLAGAPEQGYVFPAPTPGPSTEVICCSDRVNELNVGSRASSILTVHCPGSPNPQEALTIRHTQQPAVWRVHVIRGHVVPLCWPIDAGIILHIELLKGRAYLRV